MTKRNSRNTLQDVLPSNVHGNRPIFLSCNLDNNDQMIETEEILNYINQFFTEIWP